MTYYGHIDLNYLGTFYNTLFCYKFTADGLRYDYGHALSLSILFYDAQRTGKLPANNPIAWRGDSLLYERGDHGEDLSGGWFDGRCQSL